MKTKLNRILSLLAVLALSLSLLVGCGQQTTQDTAAQDTQEDTSAADTTDTQDADDAADTADADAADDTQAADDAEDADGEIADAEEEISVKHITLTVTYADETSDEYSIDTNAEFLKDAIEGTVELGGSESEYGFYIESVNGVTADYDTDGAYWAIYVNDEYGMYSVDAQPVTGGDHYALVYTVG